MSIRKFLHVGLLMAVLIGTTACPAPLPDDPWLKPKVIRVTRAPSAQLTNGQLVAYGAEDPVEPGRRNWLMLSTEPWPIDLSPMSESLIIEVPEVPEPEFEDGMTPEELHAKFGAEFAGPTIVKSIHSGDLGEVSYP